MDFQIVLDLKLPTNKVPKFLWSIQVALRISLTAHKYLQLRFFQGSYHIIHNTKRENELKMKYRNSNFQAQKVFPQGGLNEKCG